MSLLTLVFAGLLALATILLAIATVLLFLATAGLLLMALISFVYQLGKDKGAPRP
jgi:hypothetical protein